MFSLSTKKHFKIFRPFFSILLCLLLIFSGLFLSPKPVKAWTDTGGGDHGGADWTISVATTIAGNHTNIGTFTINSGITATVQIYDGSSYGSVEIHANTISIVGTLTASGKGFGGGGGGAGGGGRDHGCSYHSACAGGSGVAGGSNGANGGVGVLFSHGANGGAGGSGGGSYGGSGGTYGTYNGGNGANGNKGGYAISGGQGDTSSDESLNMGSGGGGGGGGAGGSGECGGAGGAGAGARGGGWIKLYATNSINITGNIYSKGMSNAGDAADAAWASDSYNSDATVGANAASTGSCLGGSGVCGSKADYACGGDGGNGGYGAGGGILIKCSNNFEGAIDIDGTIDNRGGGNSTTNGGTIKIFHPEGSDLTFTHYEGRHYTSQFSNTKPKDATGQGASVISYNQVDLSWIDESGIEDGYRIHRQVEGGGYSLLDTIAAGSSSYSDNSTTYNKSYQYYIVAYNGTAESDEAYTTTIYTPAANADVAENQARPTQQWYQEGNFIFSSSNLDNDYIEYYRYKWDRNPTTQVTGSDSQWITGTPTLARPPYNSKKNYLHVLGYNLNNESASQGTQHYGPYYFVETYRLLRGGKFFDDDGVLIEMGPKE